MGSAESGQEVIEGDFVRDVDRRQPKAPLVLVATEEIIVT